MIYFFELNAGEVKIGYSGKSPEERLQRALTWTDVRVLLVLPDGTRKDEKRWHRDFAHLRTAGERFTLTDELRGLIAELACGFDWGAELRRRMSEAQRLLNATPKRREALRLYAAKPEAREAQRLYSATPERREVDRLRRAKPERREAQRLHAATPEYREAQRLYAATPEAREARRLREAKPEARETKRLYNTNPERREALRLRNATPEAREAKRLYDANRRMPLPVVPGGKIPGLPEA